MRWLTATLLIAGEAAMGDVLANPPAFIDERFALDAQRISECISSVAADGRMSDDFIQRAGANCIGIGVDSCLKPHDAIGDGSLDRSTYIGCFALERRYWEWRMDRVVDTLSGEFVAEEQRDFVNRSRPELEALTSVWRSYADIKCSYETSHFGHGYDRARQGAIDEHGCLYREAAKFTLELEYRLRVHCDGNWGPNYGTACEFDQ